MSTVVEPDASEKMSGVWRFPWVSSLGSDFKYDFGAAFTAEHSVWAPSTTSARTDDPGEQAPGMTAF